MEISIYNSNKNWYYTVKKNDEKSTLENLIKKFNIEKQEFLELNNFPTHFSFGDVFIIPASEQYFHIALPLETYQTISKKFNIELEKLKSRNKTTNIFIGQKIFI